MIVEIIGIFFHDNRDLGSIETRRAGVLVFGICILYIDEKK